MQVAANRAIEPVAHSLNFREQAHGGKTAFFIAAAQVLLVSIQTRVGGLWNPAKLASRNTRRMVLRLRPVMRAMVLIE
jgi:hypothetical protein